MSVSICNSYYQCFLSYSVKEYQHVFSLKKESSYIWVSGQLLSLLSSFNRKKAVFLFSFNRILIILILR
jgi:hypothetical protein